MNFEVDMIWKKFHEGIHFLNPMMCFVFEILTFMA